MGDDSFVVRSSEDVFPSDAITSEYDIVLPDTEASAALDTVDWTIPIDAYQGSQQQYESDPLDIQTTQQVPEARHDGGQNLRFFGRLADLICKYSMASQRDATLLRAVAISMPRNEMLMHGAMQLLVGNVGDSIACLCIAKDAPENPPDDEFTMHLEMADVLYDGGMLDEAFEEYSEALELDTSGDFAYAINDRLFDISVKMGNWQQAADYADCIIDADPEAMGREGISFGKVHYLLGEYGKAQGYLDAARLHHMGQGGLDLERADELFFWEMLVSLKLRNTSFAADRCTNMRSFDEGDNTPRSPLDSRMAMLMFFYLSWKEGGDGSNAQYIWMSLSKISPEQLIAASGLRPTPISRELISAIFRDAVRYYYSAAQDAKKKAKKKAKEHERLYENFRALVHTLSSLASYAAALRADRGDDSPVIEYMSKIASMDAVHLKKMFEDSSSFFAGLPMTRKLSAEREAESFELATKVLNSFLSVFPDSPAQVLGICQTMRRSSEGPERRRLAVDTFEKYLNDRGMPDGNLRKAFKIEWGLLWREYLESLIHEREDEGEAIAEAYVIAKGYLEEAAQQYPDDPEVWLNLSWLFYTWGKKEENNFRDSVHFADAVLRKFRGEETSLKVIGLQDQTIGAFAEARPKAAAAQVAEVEKILGWSETRQADIEIGFSKFDDAKQKYITPAVSYGERNIGKAMNRKESRDAIYLVAYARYLECKAENENLFARFAPGPEALGQRLSLPPQRAEALDKCATALRYVLDEIYLADAEHVGAEVFYSLGLIQAERFEFATISRAFANPLFHTDVEEGTYYAGLIEFISMLAPGPRPESLPGDDAPVVDDNPREPLQRRIKRMERDQIEGYGAIEDILMAFKKGDLAKRKLRVAREALINALSYQISQTEMGGIPPRDRENNLLLMIRLDIDNLRQRRRADYIDLLKGHLKKAFEWELHITRRDVLEFLLDESDNLKTEALKAPLAQFRSEFTPK